MSEPYRVEPSSKLTFDWVLRQFNNIQRALTKEDGLFLDGGVAITQSDSAYAMSRNDNLIVALPDVAGTLRIDLVSGLNLRVVRVDNIRTTSAGTVAVYPDGADEIQPDVNSDPDAGPLNIAKGKSVTLLFVAGYGWAILSAT